MQIIQKGREEKMTKKEWLRRSWIANMTIKSLESELAYSDDEILRKNIEEKKQELYKINQEIYSVIDEVEGDIYFLVLFERYIALKTWVQIARDNHYSVRHIQRFHGEALKRIKVPNLTVNKKVLKANEKKKNKSKNRSIKRNEH